MVKIRINFAHAKYMERKYGSQNPDVETITKPEPVFDETKPYVKPNEPCFDDPRNEPGFKFDKGWVGHEMAPSQSKSKSKSESKSETTGKSPVEMAKTARANFKLWFMDLKLGCKSKIKHENVETIDYRPDNASKPKSMDLNAKYQLVRTYRKSIKPAYVVGKSSGNALETMGKFERPENCDVDAGCRTAPRAMTPMAWKSRYAANDANRPRSKRSSITQIDNRRCCPATGGVSGHWGKIKSAYCKNPWE